MDAVVADHADARWLLPSLYHERSACQKQPFGAGGHVQVARGRGRPPRLPRSRGRSPCLPRSRRRPPRLPRSRGRPPRLPRSRRRPPRLPRSRRRPPCLPRSRGRPPRLPRSSGRSPCLPGYEPSALAGSHVIRLSEAHPRAPWLHATIRVKCRVFRILTLS